jgi:hypothetical protein
VALARDGGILSLDALGEILRGEPPIAHVSQLADGTALIYFQCDFKLYRWPLMRFS